MLRSTINIILWVLASITSAIEVFYYVKRGYFLIASCCFYSRYSCYLIKSTIVMYQVRSMLSLPHRWCNGRRCLFKYWRLSKHLVKISLMQSQQSWLGHLDSLLLIKLFGFPQYSRNIVESGAKHHSPNPISWLQQRTWIRLF